ncbi:nucleotide exchange factor GrpE [Puteibacter caeruleilacunae]|nr:nucleotide exchange factor GrpE [Puteibacter caeruleilacunae]
MVKKKDIKEDQEILEKEEVQQEVEEKAPEAEEKKKSSKKKAKKEDAITELGEKLQEQTDKYMRLSAEFDNYRKRTLKEKMDLTKSAGESILVNILPVIDDFERALQSMDSVEETDNTKAMKEGVSLIYNRFIEFLKQNGIKEIEAKEADFDTDLHEALTKIPAPAEELKGKVVDVIQKGYYLNEKVIRFAKVVIGE